MVNYSVGNHPGWYGAHAESIHMGHAAVRHGYDIDIDDRYHGF
jgi:hypothetical protein